MNIKASGRLALIIAAGFWICSSGPLHAAEDADGGAATYEAVTAAEPPIALNTFARKSRPAKRQALLHRKSVKTAARVPAGSTKAFRKNKTVDAEVAMMDDDGQVAIPPSVANANAQLAAADLPADVNSVSTKAGHVLRDMAAKQGDSTDTQVPAPAANTELVSADQLNDIDRALSESKIDDKPALAPAITMAMAQAPPAVSSSESAWDQTSLIGKIFIAFGGLLTLASAVRMFMA